MNILFILDFYVRNGLYQRDDYADKIQHLLYFSEYKKINIEVIHDYCTMRSLQNVKNSTINRELTIARAAINFYNKHHDEQVNNPFNGFKLFEQDFMPRYLDERECSELLKCCLLYDNYLLYAFVTLALNTGSRSGELRQLEWENVNFTLRYMTVRNSMSKNRKTVHKPLNDASIAVLKRLKQDNPSKFVFFNPKTNNHIVTFRRSFSTACKNAGLDGLRIHDLRHTFASLLVRRGVPLYHVMQLLGHSDIKTTQRYAHLSNDTLAQVVEMLPNM